MNFKHIKVGDKVKRCFGEGGPPMELNVTKISARLIHCGPWEFDRETGAEVDDELGWGPPPLHTGSYLLQGETHGNN